MNNPLDLSRYLRIFQSYLGPKMYLVFGLTVIAGIFESFGIMLLFPLIESISSEDGQSTEDPSAIFIIINTMLATFGFENSIVYVLIFITVAFILKGIMTFAAMGYGNYLRGTLLGKLKSRLFNELTQVQYSYYISRDTGYFINLVNEQTTRAMNSFYLLCLFGSQFTLALVYIVFALLVAWKFGAMAFCAGIFLFIIFRSLNVYVRKLSRKLALENGILSNLLIQTLQAFKYLVATQQASKLQIKVESSINRLVNLQIATGIANSLTNAIKEPLAVVAMIMVMLFQIIVLEQSLTLILVSIVLFYRALNALLTSQLQLQKMLGEVGSLEMVEQEFTFLKNNHQIQGKNSINSFSRDISFENIDFSYTEDSKKVFSEVNLQIKSRSTVAFVGESGSGKTTLADLISLMLEPSSGRLVIDNIPSQSIQLDSWRSQIGYVSQDAIVFDDSIANNISLWGDQFDSKSDILSEIKIAAKKHICMILLCLYQVVTRLL